MSRQKLSSPRYSALVITLVLALLLLGMVLALTMPGRFTYAQVPNDGLAFPVIPASVEAADKPAVVRAYFDDPALVAWLAGWKEPWEVNYSAGYLVVEATPAEIDQLLAAGFRVAVDPVLTARLNQPLARQPGQTAGIPGYPCYRTVEETLATATKIVADYPDLATWIDIGDSWEKKERPGDGYDLVVLRLTQAAVPGPKPGIFIMSAIHAREYATAEVNTRFAEYLVENYGHDAQVTYLLDYHTVHLLLVANPDGRILAETGQYWRKNTDEDYCTLLPGYRGADLNRNFDFAWNCCGGSSGNQCNEVYRGPSPASEPETTAIQAYLRAHFADRRDDPIWAAAPVTTTGVFLDIHSYGQQVLWPWGFTYSPAGNAEALQTLGSRLAYFNNYEPEPAINLYPADGTTTDFAYGQLGLAAYTIELGTAFFQGCSTFENTIWPDNLPALLYAAKVAGGPYVMPAGPEVTDAGLSTRTIIQGQAVTLTAVLDDGRFGGVPGSMAVEPIAGAEFTIGVPPGLAAGSPVAQPMVPVDGSFDSPVEQVQAVIDTGQLSFGRHIVYIRGRDAAPDEDANWGPVGAVFLTVAPGQASMYLPVMFSKS